MTTGCIILTISYYMYQGMLCRDLRLLYEFKSGPPCWFTDLFKIQGCAFCRDLKYNFYLLINAMWQFTTIAGFLEVFLSKATQSLPPWARLGLIRLAIPGALLTPFGPQESGLVTMVNCFNSALGMLTGNCPGVVLASSFDLGGLLPP